MEESDLEEELLAVTGRRAAGSGAGAADSDDDDAGAFFDDADDDSDDSDRPRRSRKLATSSASKRKRPADKSAEKPKKKNPGAATATPNHRSRSGSRKRAAAHSDDDDDDDDFSDGDSDHDDDFDDAAPAARPRAAARKKAPAASAENNNASDADDKFKDDYDSEGYGDAADRERLEAMNEIEREAVLADRFESRQRRLEAWKMERQLRKERSVAAGREKKLSAKQGSKKAILDAMAAQKSKRNDAKNKKKPSARQYRDTDDESDDDYSDERPAASTPKPPTPAAAKSRVAEKVVPDARAMGYADIVNEEGYTAAFYLRRDDVLKVLHWPFFDKLVKDFFCKIAYGTASDNPKQQHYRFCRVHSVQEGKVYALDKVKTNKYLNLKFGKTVRLFAISQVSSRKPSREEYDRWVQEMKRSNLPLPTVADLSELKEKVELARQGKLEITNEERQRHTETWQSLNPEKINFVMRREQLTFRLKALENDPNRDDAELDRLKKELQNLEDVTQKEIAKTRNASKTNMREVFAKNKLENSRLDKLASTQKLLESKKTTLNPFARLENAGISYFSIKSNATDPATAPKGELLAPTEALPAIGAATTDTAALKALAPQYEVDLSVLDNIDEDMSAFRADAAHFYPPGLDCELFLGGSGERDPGMREVTLEELLKGGD